ncbi:NAD/NADP-dependent betaine aldehyde dehydrogenase [Aliiroseovarius pelagivivens]|uniref:NAD/NADP-dependent betaine aldehyde dehydrogenase n=1 Tax=Aliiroseovarius pelagivivens TaxID=1639690 RepID=A0A2R8ASX1_9RHOB|nr:aldehyde dehydrogenase [Aliiroseovarius pelagivivens]SPF78949.1 NAD/NADP-dependent betaine aldehyde dehydrogenase [Aliiroseovarius pelagivivens]
MEQKPHYQLFIDGQWVDGADGQVMASQNPATGQDWATFACAAPSDVERAIAAGRRVLNDPAWRDMTQTQRGKLLYRLAELIEENAQRIGQIETTDSGKLLAETSAQSAYVGDYYRYYAGLADKIEGAVLPIDKPDMHVFTRREPIGVVVAIVPWNAQMFLTATKLGPALAAGCSVVLKASEVAPAPMLEFARLIEQAGFPPGVVSVITGDAENCAIPLTRHPDVDRIAFTGGPETARHVVRNSAENFAVTSLELGGKSPILVFEDADLDGAANGLIAGNFGASGQSCVAGTRGLVHRSIFDALVKRIEDKMQSVVVGDPLSADTHIGPLCTAAQVQTIEATLQAARDGGARIRFGGAPLDRPGNYMAPTLVECPNTDVETLKVEMFGPVMSLVPFDTEDEAIAIANSTPFGLGSGVFTENVARAHRVSSRLKAGICWVNTYRAVSPIAPFGGYDQSGYGREAGLEAVLDYTRTKTTWISTSDKPMANPFVMR